MKNKNNTILIISNNIKQYINNLIIKQRKLKIKYFLQDRN